MPDPLRAAVIGTGVISKEHLAFLQTSVQANLVGVCDLSRVAAQYASQRFQAEAAYTNYKQMLAEARPDIVHVLTPPNTHFSIVTDCLKAGAHVICEKPITPTYEEFKVLGELARAYDLHLIEDYNYLFNEPILTINEIVAAGKLGQIQDIEVRMALDVRSGGRFADKNLPNPVHHLPAGVVHDVITHLCYLTLQYLPSIEQITSAWNNHGGGNLFKYDDLDALIIGQSVHARIRFSSYTRPECFEVKIRGKEGYAETDLFHPYVRTVLPRVVGKQLSPLVNHFESGKTFLGASINNFWNKIMQKTPYEGLNLFLTKTYEALAANTPLPVNFETMDRVNYTIDALLQETNRIGEIVRCE
ncbi:Gfo/Idh/MocA family oxidoreductase [Acaryochloris sp. IP29b_bin.137]|uniref:Gfo/Idh/MocA family protein n=1 Tax=Acaryochloris sp. IP29b_bin.137 TaxID=2969217 RepID=UPI00262D479F|nr:Gfo/Idh/MocA family oxidoreductase [Acaryochloris sp. IP29b_bin.137]